MIPTYLNTPDLCEPADPVYFLVAANDIFLVNKTALFTSITEARDISWLAPQKPSLRLSFPKVPRQLMEQIYGFFQVVYNRWRGEAVAFLYYAQATGHFGVAVPPQELRRYQCAGRWYTEPSVNYGYLSPVAGYVKLGDVHSHMNLPAFFSRTDSRDDWQDGLRIVLGSLDRPVPDVRASFIAQGVRFALKTEEALEDFSTPLPPPQAWLDRVTCRNIESGEPTPVFVRALPRGANGNGNRSD
jgi:proteasome lid subunit RPN8/RPN11